MLPAQRPGHQLQLWLTRVKLTGLPWEGNMGLPLQVAVAREAGLREAERGACPCRALCSPGAGLALREHSRKPRPCGRHMLPFSSEAHEPPMLRLLGLEQFPPSRRQLQPLDRRRRDLPTRDSGREGPAVHTAQCPPWRGSLSVVCTGPLAPGARGFLWTVPWSEGITDQACPVSPAAAGPHRAARVSVINLSDRLCLRQDKPNPVQVHPDDFQGSVG